MTSYFDKSDISMEPCLNKICNICLSETYKRCFRGNQTWVSPQNNLFSAACHELLIIMKEVMEVPKMQKLILHVISVGLTP